MTCPGRFKERSVVVTWRRLVKRVVVGIQNVSLLLPYAIASVMYVMPHPNSINPTNDHLNDGICGDRGWMKGAIELRTPIQAKNGLV
ncbi:uncharacterized protein LACBIDRAFT_301902 [Laccaria bicolor S238N-H82]|uniref:Predicted protein n=1 Tax=Laccaria bicolor (strain S238N-H82 / ATCC MYA-4686) TaxID=486041 RepID=B0CPV7_LACBS|nr:uncharacterized protein LACBIDRAFT_301902 [Laccaria bicolor S238N-H82]EDR16130.1 predicted protein [Laccaria bicolor S238N-H82]|eukprot:XP_001874338.1 predicted protein [Laccaria bicolor S238N-H82]